MSELQGAGPPSLAGKQLVSKGRLLEVSGTSSFVHKLASDIELRHRLQTSTNCRWGMFHVVLRPFRDLTK